MEVLLLEKCAQENVSGVFRHLVATMTVKNTKESLVFGFVDLYEVSVSLNEMRKLMKN